LIVRRREFLSRIAAGSAIVTIPGFLAGCGINRTITAAEPVPDNPFLQWFGIDEATIQRVMTELVANGADTADLYFQHKRSAVMTLDDSVINNASTDVLQGLGLRVVIDGQVGYASTEDLTLQPMLAAARSAASIARATSASLPQTYETSRRGDLYVSVVPWTDVGADQKSPLLTKVDLACRRADSAVRNVRVILTDVDEKVLIATLDGRLVFDHRPMTRLSAQVMATRGNQSHSGFASIAAREELSWYSLERLDGLTRDALANTMALFDARRPPSGEMPVILASGGCGVLLHETIGHGLEADFNRKGTSQYSDMLGEKVADPTVTIVDQATLPNERGALNYDDEGNECGRTRMIENGVLRSYLHDSISSAQYDVETTGSGRRESFLFAPMPRMTCTFMENGTHEKDEIVAAVERGVIVENITEGHVELGVGDYRFKARNGWLIEKGKITTPLRDFVISGNGPETLRRISMVANDARFDSGGWTCGKNGQSVPVSQGMPTVLVSKMNVGEA
jgi:TldD protein